MGLQSEDIEYAEGCSSDPFSRSKATFKFSNIAAQTTRLKREAVRLERDTMEYSRNKFLQDSSTNRLWKNLAQKTLGTLTLVIPLYGCETTLSTSQDVYLGQKNATIGVPYALPMTQFDITLTRSISQCVTKEGSPKVGVTMTAKAEAGSVAGETYIIDYEKLSSSMKTSSLVLEFYEDTGTLKSINAQASDKTAEVLSNVVETGIGIAKIAAGIPTIPTAATSGDGTRPNLYPAVVCSPETQAKVLEVKNKTAELKLKTTALESATKAFTDKLETLKPIIAADALTSVQKQDLANLERAQTEALVAQTEIKNQLEKGQAKVSVSQNFKWPQNFTTLEDSTGSQFKLGDQEVKKWSKILVDSPDFAHKDRADHFCNDDSIWEGSKQISGGLGRVQKADLATCLRSTMNMSAVLIPSVTPDMESSGVKSFTFSKGEASEGFLYRSPGLGTIKICKGPLPGGCRAASVSQAVYSSPTSISISQLGQLRLLPFKNKAFEDNELSVNLRKDGRLEKFEYKDKAASAEAASGFIKDTVGGISGYLAAVEADKLAKAEKTLADEKAKREAESTAITNQRAEDLALIQHEVSVIEQTVERDKLLNPVLTPDLDATNANAALLEARLRELQAVLAQLQAQATIADLIDDE